MAHLEVGSRVAALRKAVGLSQENLARRGGIDRVRLVHLEANRNKGSSHAMRLALARAFGLEATMLDAYLDGASSLRATVALCRLPSSTAA